MLGAEEAALPDDSTDMKETTEGRREASTERELEALRADGM
jgi:hypothetical protein